MSSETESDAARIAAALVARGERLAVFESAGGGLASAALLSQPRASVWYLGAAVGYTASSRRTLLGMKREHVGSAAPMSVEMAAAFAEHTRRHMESDWALAELGIAGPGASPYGGPPGVAVIAVAGPRSASRQISTGSGDRAANMRAFAAGGLALLAEVLGT